MTTPTTCTVVVGADGSRCGAPAVSTFTSSRTGETFGECADHDVAAIAEKIAPLYTKTDADLGIKTATRRPYVLVRDGKLVGYADAVTTAVEKRAARLGARIVPTR